MHQASPVRGWSACTMRYRTGSRRLMLGEAMSIFARSTRAPFSNSPARMRANRSRFSSIGRSRYGRVGARLRQRAAGLADLVGGQVVHERLAVLDEVDGPRVELLEVVRRVVEVLAPVEAQPADVRLDDVDVLLLLLDRVGVVEAQVAAAAELGRDAEVEADRLGVPDVEVAVGLGREPGDDRGVPAVPQVGGHDVADEVAFVPGEGRGSRCSPWRRLRHRDLAGDAARAVAHHTPGGSWLAR